MGSFGLGHRECTGDSSHRVSEIGKHCHLVRDCTGAQEIAGTQLIPGYRFAAAEQIRLYGRDPVLPTANPHWPTNVAAEKPADPIPVEKPKDEKLPEPKKGFPTVARPAPQAALSVNKPFTNP